MLTHLAKDRSHRPTPVAVPILTRAVTLSMSHRERVICKAGSPSHTLLHEESIYFRRDAWGVARNTNPARGRLTMESYTNVHAPTKRRSVVMNRAMNSVDT